MIASLMIVRYKFKTIYRPFLGFSFGFRLTQKWKRPKLLTPNGVMGYIEFTNAGKSMAGFKIQCL